MKTLSKVLKLIVVGCLAQSSIVFFNVKAYTTLRYTNSQYQTQVNYQNQASSYFIPTFEVKENKKQLYDNDRKIFDKDINIPKNRIEYEILKDFLYEKKQALIRFDKMNFSNLSKTTILTYRKQIENTKSLEGIIQFEKIIKTAKDNNSNEFYFKVAEYGYLIVGTFLGWLLFMFYTKKFIFRMKYVEEIPENESESVLNEVQMQNQELIAQTQVLPITDFEEASLAQTLTFVQQDFLEEQNILEVETLQQNNILDKQTKKNNENKKSIDDENTWIFSALDEGEKK